MKRALRRQVLVLAVAAAAVALGTPAGFAKTPKPVAANGLVVRYQYQLPKHVTSRFRAPLVAEAPDGVVFFAHGTTVYRSLGEQTRAAVDVRDRIYALAASASMLVVETPTDVVAYDRYTGKRVGDWDVEQAGGYAPSLQISGNVIWSLIDPLASASGLAPATLYELQVGHSLRTITTRAAPIDLAVDGAGDAFFVGFDGRLDRVSPTGTVAKSADSAYSAATLAYVGGTLIAEIDNVSTVIDEINPATLGVISSHSGHAGDYADLAITSIGALSLDNECGTTNYCTKTGVRRITLPDSQGPQLSVPYGAAVMGPDPIVLEMTAGSTPQLVGLGQA
ncbi:MAG TPA: hypothetical protein VG899_06835 [Mycobacteriales bacterium]|nr:hypothetical protein [Mycobacteriales bacterium]